MIFATMVAQLDDDNDREFILQLYKNYYNLAWKNIFRITRNLDDIEDLINDVFVKLIGKVSILRALERYKLTTYIVYTIRSVSLNYMKHKAVESKLLYFSDDIDAIDDDTASGGGVEDRLIRSDEVELLAKCAGMLPQKQRDILYFRYFLEMKDSDIAEVYGISPNSVREYLTRARRSVRELMEKEAVINAK